LFLRGKIYVVNDKNGSGKSTFIKIISGLYLKYEGDVLTDAMIEVAKNEENAKTIIDYFNNKRLENNANADTQAVEDESQAQIKNIEVATSSNANNFENKFELDSNGDVVFTKNAGKLNLNIDISIYTLNGKRNLFTIDKIGNDKKNFNDSWQGWTEDKIAQVRELASQDWFKEYGLSISSFSTGKPLSKEEITTYLNELPEDLSEDRRKVVEFALNSVGYIPYYFGGKPASSGYTGNNFYNIINPDYKGRVFRGLDCSGWVNWVMWSATENKPSAFSTSSFINTRSISKSGGINTYRSSVVIAKHAKNSKSAVSCQSLMLDNISRSDTIPAMDIRTKDADVGHEASIGRISDDSIFYLMSRGLSEEDTKALIVSGFADNVSKELPLEYAVEMNNLIRLEMIGSIG